MTDCPIFVEGADNGEKNGECWDEKPFLMILCIFALVSVSKKIFVDIFFF